MRSVGLRPSLEGAESEQTPHTPSLLIASDRSIVCSILIRHLPVVAHARAPIGGCLCGVSTVVFDDQTSGAQQ